MVPCRHCLGSGIESDRSPADRAARIEALRQACRERNYRVMPPDMVRESVAAEFVDRDVGTLQNWRYGNRNWKDGKPPIAFTMVNRRAMYHLSSIADFIDSDAK